MSSTEAVSKLLQDNLFLVFGEADREKRWAALTQLWVADTECLFIDPIGVFRTHKDISNLIDTILEQNTGKVFTVRGK
jgi:hypothetical protein